MYAREEVGEFVLGASYVLNGIYKRLQVDKPTHNFWDNRGLHPEQVIVVGKQEERLAAEIVVHRFNTEEAGIAFFFYC
jgi:hypothetical protein